MVNDWPGVTTGSCNRPESLPFVSGAKSFPCRRAVGPTGERVALEPKPDPPRSGQAPYFSAGIKPPFAGTVNPNPGIMWGQLGCGKRSSFGPLDSEQAGRHEQQ